MKINSNGASWWVIVLGIELDIIGGIVDIMRSLYFENDFNLFLIQIYYKNWYLLFLYLIQKYIFDVWKITFVYAFII